MCIDADCKVPVFAKNQGKKRAHHFAHYPANGRPCCSGTGNGGESEEHLFAKRWIAENFKRIRFLRSRCVSCNFLEQFDTRDCAAELEGRILSSKFRADVLLYDEQGVPRFAVEVFHTHRVDTVKAEFCEAHNIQILEIKAEQCRQLKEELVHLHKDRLVQVRELLHPQVVDLQCKVCEERKRVEEKAEKERVKREEEARRHRWDAMPMWKKEILSEKDGKVEPSILLQKKHKQRSIWLQQGFHGVENFVESDVHTKYKKRPMVEKELLRGKCAECHKWLVQDYRFPSTRKVFKGQMGSWKGYDTGWYRDEPECLSFCELCVTECVRCEKYAPVQYLKKYGCCHACTTFMKKEINDLEYQIYWAQKKQEDEQAERERVERERLKREQLERERAEKQRLEREQWELERLRREREIEREEWEESQRRERERFAYRKLQLENRNSMKAKHESDLVKAKRLKNLRKELWSVIPCECCDALCSHTCWCFGCNTKCMAGDMARWGKCGACKRKVSPEEDVHAKSACNSCRLACTCSIHCRQCGETVSIQKISDAGLCRFCIP